MEPEIVCVCHGDAWTTEDHLMDHQVQHYAAESRRHEKINMELCQDIAKCKDAIAQLVQHGANIIEEFRRWEKDLEERERRLAGTIIADE